jgi:hypothetical protein
MQKTGNAPSHSSSSSDSSSSSSSGGSTDEVHTTAVQRYSQAAEVAEIALSADQQKQQTRWVGCCGHLHCGSVAQHTRIAHCHQVAGACCGMPMFCSTAGMCLLVVQHKTMSPQLSSGMHLHTPTLLACIAQAQFHPCGKQACVRLARSHHHQLSECIQGRHHLPYTCCAGPAGLKTRQHSERHWLQLTWDERSLRWHRQSGTKRRTF